MVADEVESMAWPATNETNRLGNLQAILGEKEKNRLVCKLQLEIYTQPSQTAFNTTVSDR